MNVPLDPLQGGTLVSQPRVQVAISGDGCSTQESKQIESIGHRYTNNALVLRHPIEQGKS